LPETAGQVQPKQPVRSSRNSWSASAELTGLIARKQPVRFSRNTQAEASQPARRQRHGVGTDDCRARATIEVNSGAWMPHSGWTAEETNPGNILSSAAHDSGAAAGRTRHGICPAEPDVRTSSLTILWPTPVSCCSCRTLPAFSWKCIPVRRSVWRLGTPGAT
jgi:hypothetical protein